MRISIAKINRINEEIGQLLTGYGFIVSKTGVVTDPLLMNCLQTGFFTFMGIVTDKPKKPVRVGAGKTVSNEQLIEITVGCALIFERHEVSGFKDYVFYNSLRMTLRKYLIELGAEVAPIGAHTPWETWQSVRKKLELSQDHLSKEKLISP